MNTQSLDRNDIENEVAISPEVADLLRSPFLPQYYTQIQQAMATERQHRKTFLDTVKEDDNAEFINGQIVMHSPVRLEHSDASENLFVLLKAYVSNNRLGKVGHEKLMVSLTRNDYEPDVCFWGNAKASQFEPKQLRFPVPDFIAEVLSPTTEAIDRDTKFKDYAAHGVTEYWLVDPEGQAVEQYALNGRRYTLVTRAESGALHSTALPGFVVLVRAIFDPIENLAALHALMGA